MELLGVELLGVKHAYCEYNMHDVKKMTFILQGLQHVH